MKTQNKKKYLYEKEGPLIIQINGAVLFHCYKIKYLINKHISITAI